ncbi:conjugative transfer signal peptidase TraF [Marinobacter sp.]|uniref:conjugative transfer signal peptidase TraF n=1 Tax=Marinobacter sp. TaxID=50741 RepID=UPI003A900B92
MNTLSRFYVGVAIVGISILSLAAISYAAGARVNTTRSIPVGLYWTTDAKLEKGAYVFFCPPDVSAFVTAKERNYISGGFCPGDYGYMMKRILAAKGDVVTITDSGVSVNGELLPHSKPIQADLDGRKLPRYQSNQYTLGSSELLLMSDVSDTSFDGRYFGPVSRSQVKSVIRPVIIW